MMYLIVASLRSSHRSCTVLRTRVAAITDAAAPCTAFPLALRPLRPPSICTTAPGEPGEPGGPGGGLAGELDRGGGLVPTRGDGVCKMRLRQSAEVSFPNRRHKLGNHKYKLRKKGAHLAGRRHPCVLLPERADRRMAEPGGVNLSQQRRDQRRVRATRTQSLLHSVRQAGPGRVDLRRLGLQNQAAGCRARGGGDWRGGRGCDRHTLDHR
eukprot:COSAG04_NODE_2048_length_4920_cov_4.440780_4_plen_211_part_00